MRGNRDRIQSEVNTERFCTKIVYFLQQNAYVLKYNKNSMFDIKYRLQEICLQSKVVNENPWNSLENF